VSGAVRVVRVAFRTGAADAHGLLGGDPRIRALCRELAGAPGVRHVLPDRVSVDAGAEAVAERLRRETWLVAAVRVE